MYHFNSKVGISEFQVGKSKEPLKLISEFKKGAHFINKSKSCSIHCLLADMHCLCSINSVEHIVRSNLYLWTYCYSVYMRETLHNALLATGIALFSWLKSAKLQHVLPLRATEGACSVRKLASYILPSVTLDVNLKHNIQWAYMFYCCFFFYTRKVLAVRMTNCDCGWRCVKYAWGLRLGPLLTALTLQIPLLLYDSHRSSRVLMPYSQSQSIFIVIFSYMIMGWDEITISLDLVQEKQW